MLKVIALDDEPAMISSLKRMFRTQAKQYEFIGFTDVKAALLELKKEPCFVFITDIMMPDVTGDQVVAYIHKHHPEQRCIVITGQAERSHIKRIVQAGNTAKILLKPLCFDELKTVMAEMAAELEIPETDVENGPIEWEFIVR